MDSNEFRKAAHSAIDESTSVHRPSQPMKTGADKLSVIDYHDTIHGKRVVSNVSPGYLRKILPSGPPEEGEKWNDIQKDIESKIMPGLTHWYANQASMAGFAKKHKAIP